MDLSKRIEEMAKAIPDIVQLGGWAWDIALTDSHGLLKKKAIAKEFVNAGYGNIREFVNKLKSKKQDMTYRKGADLVYGQGVSLKDIDELLKEYLNE